MYSVNVVHYSVHVSDGLKNKFGWWWVGGVRSIQVYFGFFEFLNFAKPLTQAMNIMHKII